MYRKRAYLQDYTYFGIVEIANLKAGETVMINAPSSRVGIAAIQMAKMVGAKPAALTTSPEKSNVLLGLGAFAVFSPPDADLPKKVDDLSGGFARVIFDAVGGPGAALLQSGASVGAVHVTYGSLSDKDTEMSVMTLYAKRMTVRGFSSSRPLTTHAAVKPLSISFSRGLKSGALKLVITKTFPLAKS
jgi:NADPH:quinone reductase-like Zn-dependent oxidoreductase